MKQLHHEYICKTWQKKNIKEFLIEFFKSEKKASFLIGVTTYKNPECTIQQCNDNRYRSFDEILELVNTYYKNVSAKKLINILNDLKLTDSKNILKKFYIFYCDDIHKSVILYTNYGSLTKSDNKEKCKYSCNELIEMIKNK